MSEKSSFWVIETTEIIRNKVVFDEPITKEEALELFEIEQYVDILDTECMAILSHEINEESQ